VNPSFRAQRARLIRCPEKAGELHGSGLAPCANPD
jgi:hypothetical protein